MDGSASGSGLVTVVKLVTGYEQGNMQKYSGCLEGNTYVGKLLLSFVPQYKLSADTGASSNEMKWLIILWMILNLYS